MTYLKAAIATTAILTCALIAFMFLTFDANHQIRMMSEEFMKGDYAKGEKDLQKLKQVIPDYQWYLYQAYFDRAQKHLNLSNQNLEEATKALKKHQDPDLNLEIALNKALNAYLAGNDQELTLAVNQAKSLSPSDTWVQFFTGLDAFENNDCTVALDIWNDLPEQRPTASTWLKKTLEETFTPLWLSLRSARCKIEQGSYLVARQGLIQKSSDAPKEALPEINFLIGLTYIQEAGEKPAAASLPYYKIALSYFNQVPMQDPQFDKDRQQVIQQVVANLTDLIQKQSFADVPFFIQILETWNSKPELKQIASQLTALLNQDIDNKDAEHLQELAKLLGRILPPGEVKDSLAKRFESLILLSLDQKQFDEALLYWESAQQLTSDFSQLSQNISDQTASKIVTLVANDDVNLTQLTPYLAFWTTIQRDPKKRAALAAQLIPLARDMWLEEGQENKAANIAVQALSFLTPEQQKTLRPILESALKQRFEEAQKQENIDKLTAIYQAAKKLNMEGPLTPDKSLLEQDLTKAKAFFNDNQNTLAKKWAVWVLSVEPQNEQALQIAGLAEYRDGNYSSALANLAKTKTSSTELETALAVSQVLTETSKEKGLASLDKLESDQLLSRDTFLRMSLGLLIQHHPQEAIEWLNRIKDPDSEVYAALAFAAYQSGNWKDALNYFQQTQPPYNRIDGLEAIAVQSALSLNNVTLAETILNALMQQEQLPSQDQFSPPFRNFKDKMLDPIDRHFVAGYFQYTVKKNDQAALEEFFKIAAPTPEMLLLRGTILSGQNRLSEAEADLRQAASQTEDPAIQAQAIPLLGMTFYLQKQYLNAYSQFKIYFDKDPATTTYRSVFSNILRHLQLFPAALEQLKILGKENPLSIPDQIGYLECLIHLSQFDEASEFAARLIKTKPPLSNSEMLEAGLLLIITQQEDLVVPMVRQLAEAQNLSTRDAIALIHFLNATANYEISQKIIQKREEDLKQSAAGLMALAEFSEALSDTRQALNYAQQAAEKSPSDPDILQFIIEHETNPDALFAIMQDLKKALGDQPLENPSATTMLLYTTLRWIASSENNPQVSSDTVLVEKHMMGDLLAKIKAVYPNLPLMPFLQGGFDVASVRLPEAKASYDQALKLDPSFAEAAIHAALVSAHLDNNSQALAYLSQALTFQPNNPRAWQINADLSIKTEKWEQAIESLFKSIYFRPNEISNYLALAQVYLDLKSPENARSVLQKALSIAPKNIQVLSLLLRCLYDSSLSVGKNPKDIDRERREIYQKLYDLDPEYAQKLLQELSSTNPSALD